MGTVTTPLWSIGTELAVTRRREEMILVIGVMMTVMTVGMMGEEAVAAEEAVVVVVAVVAGEAAETVVAVMAMVAVVAGEEEVATLQSPVGGSRLLTRACATPTSTPTGSCTRYVLLAVELAVFKIKGQICFPL